MAFRSSVLGVLCVAACGGAVRSEPPRAKPEPVTVGPPVATRPPAVASQPPSASVSADSDYAASPLTDLARAVQAVTVAALEGRDPTSGSIPIEPIRNADRLVRSKGALPPSGQLRFFAFAMEIEIVLDRGQDPRSNSEGTIEAVAFLSRVGLKLAHLGTRSGREPKQLPHWLSGAEQFGLSVHQALRNHTARSLLVGEAERSVLGEKLYAKASEELGQLDLAPIERTAAQRSSPLGYDVDDVYLLAHDAAQTNWGFQLQFDEDHGQIVLDSSPLVRVEKLDPERS